MGGGFSANAASSGGRWQVSALAGRASLFDVRPSVSPFLTPLSGRPNGPAHV